MTKPKCAPPRSVHVASIVHNNSYTAEHACAYLLNTCCCEGMPVPSPIMYMQLLKEASKGVAELRQLTPATLCHALHHACITVTVEEADQVLQYAISQEAYTCLNGLNLVHTANGSWQKIWCRQAVANQHPAMSATEVLFLPGTDPESKGVHKLMAIKASQQVTPLKAWDQLAKYAQFT